MASPNPCGAVGKQEIGNASQFDCSTLPSLAALHKDREGPTTEISEDNNPPKKSSRKGYKSCFACRGIIGDDGLTCKKCERVFHLGCCRAGEDNEQLSDDQKKDWECQNCSQNRWMCMGCKKYGTVVDIDSWLCSKDSSTASSSEDSAKENDNAENVPAESDAVGDDDGSVGEPRSVKDMDYSGTVLKCNKKNCFVFFHRECLPPKIKANKLKGFKCPGHECHLCESKMNVKIKRCVDCLTARHMPNCGIGCEDLISDYYMVCSKHRHKYQFEDVNKRAALNHYNEIRIFGEDFLPPRKPVKKDRISEVLEGFIPLGIWRSPLPSSTSEFKIPSKIKMDVEKIRQREALRKRPPKFKKLAVNRFFIKKPQTGYAKGDEPKCNCKVGEGMCGTGSCHNRAMKLECYKKTCDSKFCRNQRLSRREWTPHVIKYTANRGFGMFAKNDVKEDDLIIEYVGEIIDRKECDVRMKKMQEAGAKNFYFLEVNNSMIIDATEMANNGRFMNHSCGPNCGAEKWIVDGVQRVGMYALRDIPAGTELTWDYNFATVGNARQKCLCGAKNCSGTFGSRPIKENAGKRKRHAMESARLYTSCKEGAAALRRIKSGNSAISLPKKKQALNNRLFLIRNVKKVFEAVAEMNTANAEEFLKQESRNA
mmetsp:Transcript_39467/g.66160  ORF Transcript_39467/g.66160 Transcript_39467/m.66160 type:complete len:652 (-) Transcript_39467:199-2154(-)